MRRRNNTIVKAAISLVALLGLPAVLPCFGQARPEVTYDYAPSQITVSFAHTLDDYQVENEAGKLDRVTLNGLSAEYSWRRFYPIEIAGEVSHAIGNPLDQSLLTLNGGAGYTRSFLTRFYPFARVEAGYARTRSDADQYGYRSARGGFDFAVSGGLDISLGERWGVRAIDVQNQYLPFGVKGEGSVYWGFGSGMFYRF